MPSPNKWYREPSVWLEWFIIVNLGFLSAFPLGSFVLIALDVLVIYALAMHGRDTQPV